ncbi:MAG: metallophosphoesterase [Clostridia bacterium]|nr:metallophosphoesterase [Clostridia bacterium]
MKLGLFTDPHYCDQDVTCRTRRPVLSYGKIREAMETFVREKVDFVLCLGDIIDKCDDPQVNIEKTREIADLIHSYALPFYSLMGNHDANVFTQREFNELVNRHSFPSPVSITVCGKELILLDANYNDDGSSYAPGEVNWKNTYIPEEQLRTREQKLNDPTVTEAYVFMHQNLDPEVQQDHIVHNAEAVRKMIRASGKVKAVFQGHYHKGHETIIDGIPYHTLPAMCEGEENRFIIVEL